MTTIDESGRSSPPLCLPPLPATNTLTNVGPIVIAPSLSQDNNSQSMVASGQSVPDSVVNIQLFQVENKPSLVKKAQAFSLPQFSTTTDHNGNFNLNLPTQYASAYRYYATIITPNSLSSAKSNSLYYQNSISQNYILFIFLFIAVIISLLILFVKKYKKHPTINHYYLALRPRYWPRRLF